MINVFFCFKVDLLMSFRFCLLVFCFVGLILFAEGLTWNKWGSRCHLSLISSNICFCFMKILLRLSSISSSCLICSSQSSSSSLNSSCTVNKSLNDCDDTPPPHWRGNSIFCKMSGLFDLSDTGSAAAGAFWLFKMSDSETNRLVVVGLNAVGLLVNWGCSNTGARLFRLSLNIFKPPDAFLNNWLSSTHSWALFEFFFFFLIFQIFKKIKAQCVRNCLPF